MEGSAAIEDHAHLKWTRGKIDEIPNISVDYFCGSENLTSTIYFVSHGHSDHMEGLGKDIFHYALFDRKYVFIYSSPITKKILEGKFPRLKSRLRELDIREPNIICVPNSSEMLVVTLIPAGHCPGSVMFLFQCGKKTVLYTGDFRIKTSDLKKFKSFHDELNKVKIIDNLYLDTTFFDKDYPFFPSRQDTISELHKVIERWLSKGPKYVAVIKYSANFAYEYLFIEIANHFKMPVNVPEHLYDVYRLIPELDKCVTLQYNTRIFTLYKGCAHYGQPQFVKYILPTAMYWKNLKPGSQIYEDGNEFRICYSTHPSYGETVGFLDYLKPKRIVACVEPFERNKVNGMYQMLADISKRYQDAGDVSVLAEDPSGVLPEWLRDDGPRPAAPRVHIENEVDDFISSILDSPTRS